MQLAVNAKYLIVALLFYLVVFGLWRMFPMRYIHITEQSIRSIVKKDLSIVGDYGDKFTNSLYKLLETIYQLLYSEKGYEFRRTMQLLHVWEEGNTFDPDMKIHCLIDRVCDDLEKRWAEYEKLGREGKRPYNVDLTRLDLPQPASTLRCNDHINIRSLYQFYADELNKE